MASVALGLAGLQVLPALWICRKLALQAAATPVRLSRRLIGFGFFALTAWHCLLAYGVQHTSARDAVRSHREPSGAQTGRPWRLAP